MTDRPIIMSAPMVKALLAGRKTVTRRVLKPQPEMQPNGRWHIFNAHGGLLNVGQQDVGDRAVDFVPWYEGQRLWVREAWRAPVKWNHLAPRDLACGMVRRYEADDEDISGYGNDAVPFIVGSAGRLRPSIHMPRWASRVTLLVTDVRVEKLQSISERDAFAEGVEPKWQDGSLIEHDFTGGIGIKDFRNLWNSLHGAGAWDANPWVAAISFDVIHANIDALPTTPTNPRALENTHG